MTAKEAIAVLQEERDHVNHHLGYEGKAEEYYEVMRSLSDALGVAISATEKQDAMKPTHEATIYKSLTCPRCKNVIDKFEEFVPGQIIRIKHQHCWFCGQKLDWDEKEAVDTKPIIPTSEEAPHGQ